jgi:hypothetical protein
MNDIFKELAKQAEFSENDLHIQGDNFQYFAELMLTEFKSVLLNMMNDGQGVSDTLDQALTEINEHFGVEE